MIEIQKSLQLIPRVRLEYFEDHRDKKIPDHNLCLLAQLNVDADRIAGHITNFPFHTPLSRSFPQTQEHTYFSK
jgi:hypothetical protein